MAEPAAPTPIITVDGVTKTFPTPDGGLLPVLDGIDFRLYPGEIVALLGKSGSGKSTLLRCIAGLISPSSGTVAYKGTQLNGANPGVAMVFQSFALLPWLTVQQNVELGLQARGVPADERRERALKAIDVIGLDGFEAAYPKELSGGMRQRVGFARALVLEPDALLMDEPFSALDVLTAENLRSEIVRLWDSQDPSAGSPTQSLLIVTHNIEEAVLLADRIMVLSSNPGRIMAELTVDQPRPRDRRSPEFEALVDQVYGILTGREEAEAETEEHGEPSPATPEANGDGKPRKAPKSPTEVPLPAVSVGGMAGLLEILLARGGEDGLAEIADDLNFEIDDLLPLVDGVTLLRLAKVRGPRIELTDAGREYVQADIQTSKEVFARLAAKRAPLVRAIVQALRASADGDLREGFFLDLLRRGFSAEDARRQLDTAIDWGRYAELFDYDADDGMLLLEREPQDVG
ncbi:nitrate/sulfonate/bicarbonate ABC transporter ATP-binding protein [Actinospica sp.]|jgi:NitT/TauT family transport system ATP-binding protein|uniref:ABC transporter ATP-binding protein n=1 Tax=Actinospica sp. TaxID=1872142 RepID=UPI002BF33B7D|nr:nitrate/sulfonate/bicarbonate ABC transporter ATP-binding protein [Actinospica sp.]HWG27627.1 nitrate/sulfonate/bicarbonate ABC transporter ATP-binding protein [Actinospica sp.]